MNYLSEEDRRVIEYLYLEGSGHPSLIARRLNLPSMTVSRILRRHLKTGILEESDRRGNIREFSLDYRSFRTLGLVCLLENERLNDLAKRLPLKIILSELDGLAYFASLYGSAVRGDDDADGGDGGGAATAGSDVDILLISDKQKKAIVAACSRISTITGIDLSPHILTYGKFLELIRRREAFVTNTVLNPKNRVFLLGIDSFLKLVPRHSSLLSNPTR